MKKMKRFLAALTAVCFLLLPVTSFASGVSGTPSPMAKPAKFPADAKPSTAKPTQKQTPRPEAKPSAGQPETIKKPTPSQPTTAAKPAVKQTPVKPAKPVKPVKAKKAKPAKKDKKSKKNEAKQPAGQINIASKETAPFFPEKKVDDLVKTAQSYIGVKYVYGGADPKKGFDCSGYIMYIFRKHGASVPRTADDQYDIGKRVADIKALVKGDLVFFSDDRREISHVGLYLGNGSFIHASSSKGIRIDSLSNEYWKPRYAGAKHLIK